MAAILDNELRAEVSDDGSQINVPPIRAERQTLDPLRAVNDPLRPFIGDFRLQVWISTDPYFDKVRRKP